MNREETREELEQELIECEQEAAHYEIQVRYLDEELADAEHMFNYWTLFVKEVQQELDSLD